jgi:hypothetical protein
MQDALIFNFDNQSDLQNWRIVDDVVMGGRSNGQMEITEEGFGRFYGNISLENNGGFSSVRYTLDPKSAKGFSKFVLKVKGDGKTYQFRVKRERNQRHSHIYEFQTSGSWETVEIPFEKMYASFRGYRLNMPNFNGDQIEEIAFLIGNKKEESFELLIDTIMMQ